MRRLRSVRAQLLSARSQKVDKVVVTRRTVAPSMRFATGVALSVVQMFRVCSVRLQLHIARGTNFSTTRVAATMALGAAYSMWEI